MDRRQLIAALLALGIVSAAHAEEGQEPGKLGYFVGYNAAIFELENGHSFCVSSEAMSSVLAATRAATAPVDMQKPAEGIVARLAKAFPCRGSDQSVTTFDSKQIAKALTGQELTDTEIASEEFGLQQAMGTMVATNDLRDGKAYCLDNPDKKLSEAFEEQQQRTPTPTLTAKFVVDAMTAGFPCKR